LIITNHYKQIMPIDEECSRLLERYLNDCHQLNSYVNVVR